MIDRQTQHLPVGKARPFLSGGTGCATSEQQSDRSAAFGLLPSDSCPRRGVVRNSAAQVQGATWFRSRPVGGNSSVRVAKADGVT